MAEPFFSVIVPAHNAAGRIRRGLDSIRKQTFKSYELIVICDDCQDNTREIAEEYSLLTFSVDWHSCGRTRNKGLDLAEGKWILFMDDDDWWIEENAFQMIHDAILDGGEDFDVLAFGFHFGERGDAFQYHGKHYIAIWNKAWKREFLERISARFPDVPHSDDVGFAEYTHPKARFRYLMAVLYDYNYMRPGSITHKLKTGELKRLEEMGLR